MYLVPVIAFLKASSRRGGAGGEVALWTTCMGGWK